MSATASGSSITSEQVRQRARGDGFTMSRRGYDIIEVNTFLVSLASQMDTRQDGTQQAASPVVEAPQGDAYERLAAHLADVLRSADEAAARVVEEARAEAERSTLEARTESDRSREEAAATLEDARRQAEEILRNAKADAEERVSSLTAKHDALLAQLREAQAKLLGAAQMLGNEVEEAGNDMPEALERVPSLPDAPSDRGEDRGAVIEEPPAMTPETENS
jgi:chromosome segregation ATPase